MARCSLCRPSVNPSSTSQTKPRGKRAERFRDSRPPRRAPESQRRRVRPRPPEMRRPDQLSDGQKSYLERETGIEPSAIRLQTAFTDAELLNSLWSTRRGDRRQENQPSCHP